MIAKIWSRDSRHTIKSCVGVLIIGTTVAAAMLIIRLVGEQRLEQFLIKLMHFKRKTDAKKVPVDTLVSDNQS